jgi:hypothetical protein
MRLPSIGANETAQNEAALAIFADIAMRIGSTVTGQTLADLNGKRLARPSGVRRTENASGLEWGRLEKMIAVLRVPHHPSAPRQGRQIGED